MTALAVALPGQILGPTSNYKPGIGTHLQGPDICASCPGIVTETPPPSSKPPQQQPGAASTKHTTGAHAALPTLSVSRSPTSSPTGLVPTQTVLPAVGATVLARVTRINPRQATVEILVVGESVCVEGWQGLIRVQDVRATEKDRVRVVESFRPGDVVRAVVISLGDQSNYYLSTANNLLGVIMATSEAGNAMYPVSWKELRDPVTGRLENRKVAKPF